MRIRAAEWFETTISYEKRTEDGATELVKETYAVDALNFADSENSITEEVAPFVSGEFSAKTIKKAAYKEVLFTDNPKHDRWYKARVQFITIDEKSGKEKPTNITFLVQSYTLQNAVKNIEEIMTNPSRTGSLQASRRPPSLMCSSIRQRQRRQPTNYHKKNKDMTKKTAKKEQTPPHEYIILEDGCMLDIFDVQTRIEEISTLWDNKVENEQAVNIIKHIKKIERITAVLNKQRDFMCSILCKRMKAKRRKIWEVADGVFVTYVEGMNSVRIDKRMLKDEYPEVYKEVARNVEMKEYIQLFMTESASEDYQ